MLTSWVPTYPNYPSTLSPQLQSDLLIPWGQPSPLPSRALEQERNLGARGRMVSPVGRALPGRTPGRRALALSGRHPGAAQLQQSGTGRRLGSAAPGLARQAKPLGAAGLPASCLAPLRSRHRLLGHGLGRHPGGW